jgi:hypothetical protein
MIISDMTQRRNKENKQRNNAVGKPQTAANPPARGSKSVPRTITLTPILRFLIPTLLFCIFALFAYWLLAVKNADYLYAVQEHSLWVGDRSFWDDKMMVVGGWAQWLGCYFTQFFYYPTLGTLLLLLLWVAIFALFMHTLRIRTLWSSLVLVPLFALLLSEVDLGYWLYYMKQPGYWFAQPVAILTALLALWGFQTLSRLQRRRGLMQCAYILLSTLALYPLIGFWALIADVWMAALAARKDGWRRTLPLWGGLLVAMLIPLLYYQLYTRMRLEDAWTVMLPYFQNDTAISFWLTVPFILVAIWPLILLPFQGCKENQTEVRRNHFISALTASAALIVGLGLLTRHFSYDNYNYKAELRIYRAIDECRYDDVLTEVRQAPGAVTRQMVIAKNIALMHKGICGDNLFRYPNTGEPPYVFDSLRVHLVQTCGTQMYYNYGKCNFACRWAIENSVEFGYDVNQLKILVRTSMMSGEFRAAQKYLNTLHNTTFQCQWADEWQAMLDDRQKYYQSAEYRNIHPMTLFNNTLDGDEGLCEMYIINYFSHVHKSTPKLQEQTLVFALIQKDIQMFWPRFFRYAEMHEQETMPIHYQEAAYLYGQLEHQVDISNMPFDPERIVNRYASFNQATQQLLSQGMDTKQVGEATKATFGDTFWWFYFFCRDIHSY